MNTKIEFPKIENVELSDFDLYTRKPDVSVNIDRSVFCVIGANGLGKSTFLNTLIYGLTGGIPVRNKGFQSAKEYGEEARRIDVVSDYFNGRISEDLRETSAVSVQVCIGATRVVVERSIFGDGRAFECRYLSDDSKDWCQASDGGVDPEEAYRELVVELSGVQSFDQYTFLVHFLQSFDEARHLLLWNSDALTYALYLAFGSDIGEALKANTLRRDVERFSSQARNTAFAARKARGLAKELESALEDDSKPAASTIQEREIFRSLEKKQADAEARLSLKQAEFHKTDAQVSEFSARLAELQIEYNDEYVTLAVGGLLAREHPTVRVSIEKDECAVCGATNIASSISEKLAAGCCPLCDSELSSVESQEDSVERLKEVDSNISKVRLALDDSLKVRKRLKEEVSVAEQASEAASSSLTRFLEENPNVSAELERAGPVGSLKQQIEGHYHQAEKLVEKSKAQYRKRDKARKALIEIEKELQRSFDEGAERFIILFREYAEQFIGLAVDVELSHQSGKNETGFLLLLNLEQQTRSTENTVSESQRFFLDIALRMALAEFMAESSSSLFIDTPEGSLDISYEAQAGEMFHNFAERGNQLLMTANLRSSALVLNLASESGHNGMRIERMTDWTDLSAVQHRQEDLFEGAYSDIENALSEHDED